MSEEYVIGVDHGYAAMKTVHGSFPSGLVAYEHEPYTQKNVLEYGGKYYVVGSGRQPLQKFAQKAPHPPALPPPSTARTAGSCAK